MAEEVEILPCRFCCPNQDRVMMGAKSTLNLDGDLWEGFRWYCDNCGWGMPASETEKDADDLWNRMNAQLGSNHQEPKGPLDDIEFIQD